MEDDYWYGRNGAQLKCPVTGCDHVGSIITKAHCRLAHDMDREEVGRLYGMPVKIPKKNIGWDIKRG